LILPAKGASAEPVPVIADVAARPLVFLGFPPAVVVGFVVAPVRAALSPGPSVGFALLALPGRETAGT
jgi:hypothetical protein